MNFQSSSTNLNELENQKTSKMKKTITQYKAIRDNDQELLITYSNGILTSIDFSEVKHTEDRLLLPILATEEVFIGILEKVTRGVIYEQVEISDKRQKMAMWYDLYKDKFGMKYKVAKTDPEKTVGIEFTEELVKHYLNSGEWWAKSKTIGAYCGQINNVLLAVKSPTGVNYPDHFDRKFHDSLPTDELPNYWAHLRSKGLKVKKVGGAIVDFIPAT